MIEVTCPTCSVRFGMTEEKHDLVKRLGHSFYCPNGHSLSYRETELDRAQKRIASLENHASKLCASRDYWLEETRKRDKRIAHMQAVIRGLQSWKSRYKKALDEAKTGVKP